MSTWVYCVRRSLPLLGLLWVLMGQATTVLAAESKYASEDYNSFCGGFAIPPNSTACNSLHAKFKVGNQDAGKGLTSDKIRFELETFFEGDTISGNTITVTCPGVGPVVINHDSISLVMDDGGAGSPDCQATTNGDVNLPLAQVFALPGATDGWCHVSVPATGTACNRTWTFNNVWYRDTTPPDITTQNALATGRIDPTPGGKYRLQYRISPTINEGEDPDGTCITGGCNRSDNFFGADVYVAQPGTAWGNKVGTSTGVGEATGIGFFDQTITGLVTTNRNDSATPVYCYALKLIDDAGNLSALTDPKGADGVLGGGDDSPVAASGRPRCFVPDGKAPSITKVEVYHDANLLEPVITDSEGRWAINRTENNASPGAKDGVVYIKVFADEPLFDPAPAIAGSTKFGSPFAPGDAFDNDGDGLTDEELPNGGDDDGDGIVDEDLKLTGCAVTVGTPGDGIDNDCDGYIDEDDGGGADVAIASSVCGGKKKHLLTIDGDCKSVPLITITGADPDGTRIDTAMTFRETPTAFRSLSETVYIYAYTISAIEEDDDYVMKFSITDGVGNEAINIAPLSGGTIRLDNTPPTYEVSYYKDVSLSQQIIELGIPLLPTKGVGSMPILVESNEEAKPPLIKINQPGTTDISDQVVPQFGEVATNFVTTYTVVESDGVNYIDGTATVTIKGQDLAGNWTGGGVGSYINPELGQQFRIDTLPPNPATITPISPSQKATALGPSNTPTSTPSLKWDDSGTDAVSYQVQLATNSTFSGSAIIRNVQSLTKTAALGSLSDNLKDEGVCATDLDCNAAAGFECATDVGVCRQYYYWRLAPYDLSGNQGEFTDCLSPPCVTTTPYRFRVDAQPPKLTVEYYKNFDGSVFSNPLTIAQNGQPVAIPGQIFIKLTSNEFLGVLPSFSINQPGSVQALNQPVTEIVTGLVYKGEYIVREDDDSSYKDGTAILTYTARDQSGNQATNVLPLTNSEFLIDTKPPVINFLTPARDPAGPGDLLITAVISEPVVVPFTASITGPCIPNATVVFDYVPASLYSYTGSYPISILNQECDVILNASVTDYANQVAGKITTFKYDTVAPVSPVLLNPKDNANAANPPNQNLQPVLSWQSVSDAVRYHLEMGTDQTFANSASLVVNAEEVTTTEFLIGAPLGNPDGNYFWRVRAVDAAGNKTTNPQVFRYTTDNTPPPPPVLNSSIPATTRDLSIAISGTTEPLASVEIFRGGTQVQLIVEDPDEGTVVKKSVTAGANGAWTFIFDNDGDGLNDEDPLDDDDNDNDGQVDEDAPDFALAPGVNSLTAKATDRAGNQSDLTQPLLISLDTGPPAFTVAYYKDEVLLTQVPIGADGLAQVGVGTVFFKITSSEKLQNDQCTYSVRQAGSRVELNKPCLFQNDPTGRTFVGSFSVQPANGGTNVDGQAVISLTATDLDGNTATDTEPLVGSAFRIDTSAAVFKVTVYKDAALTQLVPRNEALLPIVGPGVIYLKVESSEGVKIDPFPSTILTVNHPGSSIENRPLINLTGSTNTYVASYSVRAEDGSAFRDGIALVTFAGEDLAGNVFENLTPAIGANLVIDSKAPNPPTITLPVTETNFVEVTATVKGEAYGKATIFVSRQFIGVTTSAGDGLDNDGDGFVDEEPGGANGLDDDLDGFVDEDYSNDTCPAGAIRVDGDCESPSLDRRPYFVRTFDESGQGPVVLTLGLGDNYISGVMQDAAGNKSAETGATLLKNIAPQLIDLEKTFPTAGWNLVSVPMVPATLSPTAGFRLNTEFVSVAPPTYRTGSQLAAMTPGVGYWVNIPTNNTTVVISGLTSKSKILQMKPGWNLIGVPYNKPVPWSDQIFVSKDNSNSPFPLGSATAGTFLHQIVYRYDAATGEYTATNLSQGDLLPFEGYFLLVKDACSPTCQLIFPEPP